MLLDHYEISDSPLGRGGFGVVYRGHRRKTGQEVAVKFLTSEWTGIPDRDIHESRFIREGKILKRLAGCPNIVSIQEFGLIPRDGGFVPALVMELCAGLSLRDALKSGHSLSVTDVLDCARQMSSALHFAHSRGIIHRDIKPSNIMLDTESGMVKLLDFGIARFIKGSSLLTLQPTAVTTPSSFAPFTVNYASPEQLTNKELDERSDLHSLGALLFELLTGQRAFKDWRRNIPPVFPANPKFDLPVGLKELVVDLLRIDPAERPESALGVYRSLTDARLRLAHSEPCRTPSTQTGRKSAAQKQKWPALNHFAEEVRRMEGTYGPLHIETLGARYCHAYCAYRSGAENATALFELVMSDRRRVGAMELWSPEPEVNSLSGAMDFTPDLEAG